MQLVQNRNGRAGTWQFYLARWYQTYSPWAGSWPIVLTLDLISPMWSQSAGWIWPTDSSPSPSSPPAYLKSSGYSSWSGTHTVEGLEQVPHVAQSSWHSSCMHRVPQPYCTPGSTRPGIWCPLHPVWDLCCTQHLQTSKCLLNIPPIFSSCRQPPLPFLLSCLYGSLVMQLDMSK